MSFFIHLFLMTKYPFNSDMLALGKKFNEAGFSLYLVGGAVRDFLLKKENDDADFTTDATPDEVIKLFPKATIPTGIKHGTVTVIFNKQSYEITTFRTEGKYSDSRHPDSVSFVRSLEEDLSRRDFSVNAFAASTKDGSIIDLHNGFEDLQNKVIRAIGCPKERFDEDALRMLRAVRFAAKLGFKIEENTFNAIKNDAKRITIISKERIREEVFKIVNSPNPSYGFKLLRESGLLKYIIPELDNSFGFEQLGNHKEDVFSHTLSALEIARKYDYPFIVKLAILFHDLGKIEARRGNKNDGYTFYGHEAISADIAKKVGVHPSTISRSIKNKYLQTPHMTISFKQLFQRPFPKTGQKISKEDLKQKLHQIISTENTQHPYSDAQLTEILSQYCGRPLSRRLIQKYRTLLHIANSYERRY